MAAPPKTFFGPSLQRCLVYDGELYLAAEPAGNSACTKRKAPATGHDNVQTTMQKLQRMLDAVEGNLIRALVKHQQLEAAAIWDRSLKLAAQACSSRPDLLTQAIMRCYTKGGTRRGDACLLEEVAGLFIEGLVVHGSPLGNLPPVDSWPAPCLWSWEVDGSEYYPPQPNNGLAAYLGHINDERYRLEQHNAWMRFLKPLIPRFIWLPDKELLLRQMKAMDALIDGDSREDLAFQELTKAKREVSQRRSLLGNFVDPTLLNLEEAVHDASRAFRDIQLANSCLVDWYKTASFVLTGHAASTRPLRRDEYPLQRMLDSSMFGVDCLEALATSTEPFFINFEDCCAPAWGVFWDWALTGALKKWLPVADSLDASLSLLRERELRPVRQQWENTPTADRFELLQGWLSGPGAIFPERVAGMVGVAAALPPVSEAAPIYKQLRATNPWRGDCEYESRDEALFGLPNKSACHLCGAEEIDRLSSLRTNCSHAACSVCYTITHRDTFIDGGCPVHCGGTGRISRDSPHQVPCLFEQFVEASLTSR